MGVTAKRHESVRHCPTRGGQPLLVFTILYFTYYSSLYFTTGYCTAIAGHCHSSVCRARDVSFVGAAELRGAVLVSFKCMVLYFGPVVPVGMFVVLS